MFGKTKITALVAEFLGTCILSVAIFSVASGVGLPFFNALTSGLTLAILTLVLGSASGAQLNPAVTFGLWTLKKIQTTQAVAYISAQLLGGVVAWALIEALIVSNLDHSATWGLDKRVLAAEALGTFVFTFGVAAAVYNTYEGGKLAATIGGSFALGVIIASIVSSGFLNPAVAIGFNSISWAYAVGPLLGSALGMGTYSLLYAPITAKKYTKKKSVHR